MKIYLLINMQMPTIVGIFILSEKISCSAELSLKKFYNLGAWTFAVRICSIGTVSYSATVTGALKFNINYFSFMSTGKLLLTRNTDPDEFWAALFEKAYAK